MIAHLFLDSAINTCQTPVGDFWVRGLSFGTVSFSNTFFVDFSLILNNNTQLPKQFFLNRQFSEHNNKKTAQSAARWHVLQELLQNTELQNPVQ